MIAATLCIVAFAYFLICIQYLHVILWILVLIIQFCQVCDGSETILLIWSHISKTYCSHIWISSQNISIRWLQVYNFPIQMVECERASVVLVSVSDFSGTDLWCWSWWQSILLNVHSMLKDLLVLWTCWVLHKL